MIGDDDSSNIVHFLLMGHSKEHLTKAVLEFRIQKMVIITTSDVAIDAKSFISSFIENGIEICEILEVDPFHDDSLQSLIVTLLDACDRHGQQSKKEIIIGLTGGTNLMAIAMGMVAMIRCLRCHYILPYPGQCAFDIELFKNFDPNCNLQQIESCLRGCNP